MNSQACDDTFPGFSAEPCFLVANPETFSGDDTLD